MLNLNKINPRLALSQHFDKVSSSIDIEAEEILLNLNQDGIIDQEESNTLNETRNDLISKIKEIQCFNIKYYDANKSEIDSTLEQLIYHEEFSFNRENICKEILFKQFCFYLDSSRLKQFRLDNNRQDLGILIICDYYIYDYHLDQLV